MKTLQIEGKIYKLTEIKKENKDYAIFILTMPNCGSWNGKWTGKDNYSRTKRIVYRNKSIYPNLKEDNFYYNFGDGWGANVEVKFITKSEAKIVDKTTKGFYGYDWMIDSILKHNKIIIERKLI